MNTLKNKDESKGIVLFAFNTDTVDYVTIADRCATLATRFLRLPVTLITDQEANPKFDYDKIVRIDYAGRNQRTDVVTKKQVQWKNFNRHSVLQHSPYDNTIMIDTDYVVLDTSLLKLLDQDYDYLVMGNSNDFQKNMPTRMGNIGLPYVWATVVLFRKTTKSRLFFNLVGRIQRNWGYYRSLFNVDGSQFRNDYAFAMANIVLNGYSLDKRNCIPWNMLTISDEIVSIDQKNNMLIVRTPNKAYMIPKHNIHVMHKQYLTSDEFKTFVEQINV
jgi:hypothetical protein